MLKHVVRRAKRRSRSRSKERKTENKSVNEKITPKSSRGGGKISGASGSKPSEDDDYGFLIPTGYRKPIITLSTHSPRLEVDYFDDSILETAFLSTSVATGDIPISFGALGPAEWTVSCDCSYREIPPSPIPTDDDSLYLNIDNLENNQVKQECDRDKEDYYSEKMESHYARLSEVRYHENTPSSDTHPSKSFQFYETNLNEVRARSQSRNCHRSRSRGRERSSNRSTSRGRSCSKSREIMALYTKRPLSNTRDRSKSPELSPRKNTPQHIFSARNINNPLNNAKRSIEPATHKHASATNFVTLLEMDNERNAEIERDLMLSNSTKPANIKMMMIASHMPSKDWAAKDEMTVKAGEIVTGLYKQNDWLFIRTKSSEAGFVPYAFTKPVKVATGEKSQKSKQVPQQNDKTAEIYVKHTKPIAGILKNSNSDSKLKKQPSPRYSVNIRTSTGDNESIGSENGSYQSDFVFSQQRFNVPTHADCIVVDIDDSCPSLNSPAARGSEDQGTYCSDSGISDPNSNHSDDLDMLNSPTSFANGMHSQKKLPLFTCDTSKHSNERIDNGTTRPFEPKMSRCSQPHQKHYESITQMPLGPLGQRLERMSVKNQKAKQPTQHKVISFQMKERAKSTNKPSSLRPEIPKDYTGPRVTVVYDYSADNEDDLEVKASDIVTVLNAEDIEWIWVQRRDGKEGFIPREYVIALDLSLNRSKQQGLVSSL